MSQPVDIEALLQHRPFVKRLALRLVRDHAQADDLVQETYVTALEKPPRHAGALRAWLATVVRKLAWTKFRGDQRRARREQLAAPPPAVPPPDEIVERAAWHQRLVNHVMELDEPYRSTLLLRFFEELNSAEIARLQNVPAATVRTRIRRGLDQLRGKLDGETEGGRARWVGGLLLLAHPDPLGLATPAAQAVSKAPPALVPLVAGVLGIAAIGVLVWGSRQAPTPREPDAAARRAVDRATERPPMYVDPEPSATGPLPEDRFRVTVFAGGRPAPGARVLVSRLPETTWRFVAPLPWERFAEQTTRDDGEASWRDAPRGYLRVLASLPGFGRGEAIVHWPPEFESTVIVELPPERVLVLEAPGVPRAEVTLREADGALWEAAPPTAWTSAVGTTRIRGVPPDTPLVLEIAREGYATARVPVAPDTHRVVAHLEPTNRTLRWPLGGPAPTGPVRVRRIHDREATMQGRIEGAHVVVPGLGPGAVPELLAIAADDSFARLGDVGAEVRFAAPPVLEIVCRDARDRPVRGVDVVLFDLATHAPLYPDGTTDSEGRLFLPVYAAEAVEIAVRTSQRAAYRSVHRFDPAQRDRRVRVTLPRGREVVLTVAGGVPPGCDVFVDRVRLTPDEVVRDEAGRLRFTARPRDARDSVDVHLLAPGRVPHAVTVPLDTDEPATAIVEWPRAGALELSISRAAPRQSYRLALVDADGRRLRRGPWSFRLYAGPDDVVRETMLPAGAFRVRDLVSGRATPLFGVTAGGVTRLHLDLPARDETVDAPAPQPEVSPNRAALRLVPVPGPSGPGETTPRVRFARDHAAVVADGVLRFSGFEPGQHDLWIDVAGYAPVYLPAVSLAAGTNDVGTVTLWRGSSIRIRVLGRDGEPLPDLVVSASADGAFPYQRSLRTDGRSEAVLQGLGAGRFRFAAWERHTGNPVGTRVLYLDGSNQATIELDLR